MNNLSKERRGYYIIYFLFSKGMLFGGDWLQKKKKKKTILNF